VTERTVRIIECDLCSSARNAGHVRDQLDGTGVKFTKIHRNGGQHVCPYHYREICTDALAVQYVAEQLGMDVADVVTAFGGSP